MTERKEHCPFAFRKSGDTNVMCRKIAENPNSKWIFCAHQYYCGQTRRWEATKNKGDCPLRKD